MGGINFTVHPLFFVLGFYYAVTGQIFVFIIYTVVAVLHELGHSFVASGAGYRLKKITLMPFGAIVTGKLNGLKLKDEIKIAMAGPLINVAVGLLFVAGWWIYPESYAFTDIAAQANFSMALINLLPVFPLDGGRVFFASLSLAVGEDKAFYISKVVGISFAVLLSALFILSLFGQINISLMFFSAFVFFGVLGKHKENKYIKLYSSPDEDGLLRGMPYKKQALSINATVKKLMLIIDERAMNEIVLFDGDKAVTTLSQKKIGQIVEQADLYAPIRKYI